VIAPFGDEALRFAIPEGIDRRALLDALRSGAGVRDAVVTEALAMVVHDGDPARAGAAIRAALASARAYSAPPDDGRGREHAIRALAPIEVVYDGEDLDAIARELSLTRDVLVAMHAAPEYVVSMMGFQPGFAYLRGGDPRLALPRRASPRTRVPERSVAIAAGYTGIYPFSSPGGWHLLGRAPAFVPFDDRGAALALGDRVRFVPVDRAASVAPRDVDDDVAGAHVEITKLAGVALLVDGGRVGHMHEGVPHGGALVRGELARANAAAGNPPGACAIELHGSIELTSAGRAVAFATGRSRVRYVAIEGGFAVPSVLGSRTTLLAARMGGFHGRLLRRGDRIPLEAPRSLSSPDPAPDQATTAPAIAIAPGPDALPRDVEHLLDAPFTISTSSDRAGTRLEGPSIAIEPAQLERPSAPMMRGAIEITPRGLIVLGPDHPTTGGYPVIAVVRAPDLDPFFARPLGSQVRFRV
jgi:allophanate hydrolase subunit 1/allophanate hydrolase subunit 2